MLPPFDKYAGRMPAWVKHYFLSTYIERLTVKIASSCDDFVYIDGFSGPWQSDTDDFEDTSFGIALQALRQAKATWKRIRNREVRMTALLVEKNAAAYARLEAVKARFPDIQITTFKGDFVELVPKLIAAIPSRAFTFILMDPKGYAIDMKAVQPLLARPRTEAVFNFMFDFINRASVHPDPLIIAHLDALMPDSNWQERLANAVEGGDAATRPARRKAALVSAFSDTLKRIGSYAYALETPVYYPLADRTFYSLFYATRSVVGLEVFRDCQVATLVEQEDRRGAGKIADAAERSGQTELFGSLSTLAANPVDVTLATETATSRQAILSHIPSPPGMINFSDLWPRILSGHVVRKLTVKQICVSLYKEGLISIPNWEPGRKTLQEGSSLQLIDTNRPTPAGKPHPALSPALS